MSVTLGPLMSEYKDDIRFYRRFIEGMTVKDKGGGRRVLIPDVSLTPGKRKERKEVLVGKGSNYMEF